MILSDSEIMYLSTDLIDPFILNNVQPASIDVRLGNDFKIFQRDKETVLDFHNPVDITKDVHVEDGEAFTLHPGEFALGVTLETLSMPVDIVGRLEGKSSVGRLGLFIHVTAGFIDPGFRGPITLEMYGLHPLPMLLYPGDLIAQVSFHKMSKPAQYPYSGRYQNAKTVESSKYGIGQQIGEGATEIPVVPYSKCCNALIETDAPGSGDLSSSCSNCGMRV